MKRTEHTQKWLDALRSGEYKQGQGGLRRGDEFCCLGVACDVYAAHEWIDRSGYHAHTFGAGALSDVGIKTFGLTALEADELIEMNDNLLKTFPEIADAIEQMLNGN